MSTPRLLCLLCLIACVATIAPAQKATQNWPAALPSSGDDTPQTLAFLDSTPASAVVSSPPVPCSKVEIHALDFLIGDRESATGDPVNHAGIYGHTRNHIEPLLGGCVTM